MNKDKIDLYANDADFSNTCDLTFIGSEVVRVKDQSTLLPTFLLDDSVEVAAPGKREKTLLTVRHLMMSDVSCQILN